MVEWQMRYSHDGGNVLKIGYNGDVIASMNPREVEWLDLWMEAGRIDLDNLSVSPIARKGMLLAIQDGAMRHVVQLIAQGWGEEPPDVVDWFKTPEDGRFVVQGTYTVDKGGGMFEGLEDSRIDVLSIEPTKAQFVFGTDTVELELNSMEALGDFLAFCSPTP